MSTFNDGTSNAVLGTIVRLLSVKSLDANRIRDDSSSGACPMTPQLHCCGKNFIVHCPGLSLFTSGTNNHSHFTDRMQAKDHAVTLLTRPFVSNFEGDGGKIVSELSRTLVQNVLCSIAMLVDSRLHAYTDLLTHHAIELATTLIHNSASCCDEQMMNTKVWLINEKKLMIQLKGMQTEAKNLSSQFDLIGECSSHHGRTINVATSAVRHTVSFDLHIPGATNESTVIVPVSFSHDGCIKCTFSKEDNLLQGIMIDLDTNDLLGKMIQQTTRSVSKIVDVANQAASLNQQEQHNRKRPLSRSISYLTMPPPPPSFNRCTKNAIILSSEHDNSRSSFDTKGLDLLCSAVSTLPVVISPHFSNAPTPLTAITPVDLSSAEDSTSSSNDDDDSVQNLSIDQCADIVDVCLFGESFRSRQELDCSTAESSLSKRTKIED